VIDIKGLTANPARRPRRKSLRHKGLRLLSDFSYTPRR